MVGKPGRPALLLSAPPEVRLLTLSDTLREGCVAVDAVGCPADYGAAAVPCSIFCRSSFIPALIHGCLNASSGVNRLSGFHSKHLSRKSTKSMVSSVAYIRFESFFPLIVLTFPLELGPPIG